MRISHAMWVCGVMISLGVANAAQGKNFEIAGGKGEAPNMWEAIKLENGCFWITHNTYIGAQDSLAAIHWSGGCNSKGFIEGDGYIGLTFGPSPLSPDGFQQRIEGSFVNGVSQGAGSISDWSDSGSGMEPYQGAEISWSQGCVVDSDECNPADGRDLIDFVIAEYLTPKVTPSAPANVEKKPVEGNNATACLALDPKPDARGDAILRNSCDFLVHYARCFLEPTPYAMYGVGSCTPPYTEYAGMWIISPRGTTTYGKAGTFKSLPVFGCQDPAWPVKVVWINGGLSGRCEIPE